VTIRYLHKRAQIWVRHNSMSMLKLLIHRDRRLDGGTNFNQISILFLSQNRIGDTLITTPIYAALKRTYPNCVIDVLLSRGNAQTLINSPHIRSRHIIKQKPFDLLGMIFQIRKQRYDFIVDLVPSKSATSTAICLLGKSRYTVGLIRENDYAYDIKVEPLIGSANNNHGVRMLENVAQLLQPFGITPNLGSLKTEYYPSEEATRFAQQVMDKVIRNSQDGDQATVIGINISASKPSKYWGRENFQEVIKSIRRVFPSAIIVVLYSSDYRCEAEEISTQLNVSLCDETKSLSEFAAVISRLGILITPDSASVHFADIYHVPLVILTSEPSNQQYWYPVLSDFEILHAPAHQPIRYIGVSEVEGAFIKLAKRIGLSNDRNT